MNPAKALQSSLLVKMFGKPEYVEDMPAGNELKKQGEAIAHAFTTAVEGLMNFESMPNVQINKLMWTLFNLCRTQNVLTAMTRVPTVHFWVEQKRGEKAKAIILFPENLLEQIKNNLYFVLGGFVFAASQAQDFWNEKITEKSKEEVLARARAYEAEYLLTLKYNIQKDYQMNDYQKGMLEKFPDGLRSVKSELKYEPKDPP